jgi:hypothetical protein
MQTEFSDAELDLIWELHLDGHDLPQHVLAAMTIRGPAIHIRENQYLHCWVKSRAATQGRFWHKTLVIG